MSLGRRQTQEQPDLWVPTTELPRSPGHAFYDKLNAVPAQAGFGGHVEALCQPYYVDGVGRESIPPGVYFRMLLCSTSPPFSWAQAAWIAGPWGPQCRSRRKSLRVCWSETSGNLLS